MKEHQFTFTMYTRTFFTALLLSLPSLIQGADPSGCSGTITSSGGRKIAIVIDSSGSMVDTDPNNLRISAGEAIVKALLPSDRVTVIDFDDSVRIVSPLGPPSTASFAGIDSDGGTYIAGGVEEAINETTKNPNDATSHVTGIVVLTDGEDASIDDLVAQLNRAASLGIRVSFGFLNPGDSTDTQDPSVLATILGTGGIYSTIDSDVAQAQFVNLVLTHGLADVDAPSSGTTLLLPGLTTAGNVSASSKAAVFTYDAQAGEALNFTVTSITAGVTFDVSLKDKTANKDVSSQSTDATTGIASILYTATAATNLELDVTTKNTTGGLFGVQLQSSVNRTISVCGSTNTTSTNSTVPSGGSTANVSVSSTLAPTPSATGTKTASSSPLYTGAASAMGVGRDVAAVALFPVLMALVF